MRPFNLDEYLKDPSRKVVTRDRHDARILCTDAINGSRPIIALVKLSNSAYGERCMYYRKEGKFYTDSYLSNADLFFADDPLPDFKAYDRVLTRGSKGLPWKANLFSNFKKVGDNTIAVCLKGDYLLSDIIPFDESKVGKIE